MNPLRVVRFQASSTSIKANHTLAGREEPDFELSAIPVMLNTKELPFESLLLMEDVG